MTEGEAAAGVADPWRLETDDVIELAAGLGIRLTSTEARIFTDRMRQQIGEMENFLELRIEEHRPSTAASARQRRPNGWSGSGRTGSSRTRTSPRGAGSSGSSQIR